MRTISKVNLRLSRVLGALSKLIFLFLLSSFVVSCEGGNSSIDINGANGGVKEGTDKRTAPSAINPRVNSSAIGEATLIWDNPAHPVLISSVIIAYRGYDTATDTEIVAGSSGSLVLNASNGNENLLKRAATGLHYNITDLNMARYYAFTLTLTYADGRVSEAVTTDPSRVAISLPVAAPAVNPQVSSSAIGEATLIWDNPVDPATIESVTISYRGYDTNTDTNIVAGSAGSVVLNATNGHQDLLTRGATGLHYNITDLNMARYYAINLTLTYADGRVSEAVTTDPSRVAISLPVAAPAINPQVSSSAIGEATLIWDNPVDPATIESITIAYRGYDTATDTEIVAGSSGSVILNTTNGYQDLLTRGATGLSYNITDLNAARYYAINLTLTYADGRVSETVTTDPSRVAISLPVAAPAINPQVSSSAIGEATLSWDNPIDPATIESIIIAYRGYDTDTNTNIVAGSSGSVILNTASDNEDLLTRGATGLSYNITDLNMARYYAFTLTLTYADGRVSETVTTDPSRVAISLPVAAPAVNPQVSSDNIGEATLSWDNPAHPALISSVTIAYRGYDTDTNTEIVAGSSGSVILNRTNGHQDLLTRATTGLSYNITNLNIARYYAFNLTLTYADDRVSKSVAMNPPRVAISLPVAAPAINPQVSSSAIGEATLSWSNPAHPVLISSVTIAYRGYDTNISNEAVTGSAGSVVLNATNGNQDLLTRGATGLIYNITDLSASRYYDFTLTLTYADGRVSETVTTDPSRVAISLPVAAPAINPQVSSSAIGEATLIWDNPVDPATIESITIAYRGYDADTNTEIVAGSVGSVILNRTNGNQDLLTRATTDLSYNITDLNAARYYAINLTLTYADGRVSEAVTTDPSRVAISLPVAAPAINPQVSSSAIGEATLSWDNPVDPATIESITIAYRGYTTDTNTNIVAGSAGSVVLNRTNGNEDLLTRGATGLIYNITDLSASRYYDFTLTLTYADGRVSQSVTTHPPRVAISLPVAAPAINPQVSSSAIGEATLSWSNPAHPVLISSVIIAYRGYDTNTDTNIVAGSVGSVILNASNGNQDLLTRTTTGLSYNITDLNMARYYAFTLTLTYADGRISESVIASPNPVEIMLPDSTVPVSITSVESTSEGEATLIWSNPIFPVPIESVTIAYRGYITNISDEVVSGSVDSVILNAINGNRALLSRGTTGLSYTLTGLNFGRAYGFNITLTYKSLADTATVNSERVSIMLPANVCPSPTLFANTNDLDGDGCLNSDDVDFDNDGLIDIDTADKLNMTRNNLEATGLSMKEGEVGNIKGCPVVTVVPFPSVTACRGYELISDIDLAAAGYTNWEPIGNCGNGLLCDSSTNAKLLSAIFEGNNHTISNFNINIPTASYGVGLFGAISVDAELRNIHISGRGITANNTSYIGGLAGYAKGAIIKSSSAILDEIRGIDIIGGLIGVSDEGIIKSSSAILDEIIGNDIIGGLSGLANGAEISSSSATAGNVKGFFYVGGLVGHGIGVRINSSLAIAETIQGNDGTGGLLGFGTSAIISYSSSIVRDIIGSQDIGGLLGWGRDAVIISSFSRVGEIHSNRYAGGLLSYGSGVTIDSSYAVADTINATSDVGYLIASTRGNDIEAVNSSYWDTNITFVNANRTLYNASNPYYYGRGFSKEELQSPTIFDSGIYADWDSVYCNSATGEYRNSPAPNFIPIWDLGSASQYPALNCLPISPNEQRNIIHQLILLDTDADGISNYFDTDDDGDNIADVIDNCPLNINLLQNDLNNNSIGDVCDDTDNDGIVDAYDLLPYDDTKAGDHDGDGVDSLRDNDDDGDGVADIGDNYPYNNTKAGDLDGDGLDSVQDDDDDNDGVIDADDEYPYDSARIGDPDRDNVDSLQDVDADGDGLIEIGNATELNMTRNNLLGTGLSSIVGEKGDSSGCGGGTDANGINITACGGYELISDIDLAAAGYTNWVPIGNCGNGLLCDSSTNAKLLSAIFEGNNHTISNFNINIPTASYGVGLFGAIAPVSELRNIHISGSSIIANHTSYIGGLAGYAKGATIKYSSAILDKIIGNDIIGGLIGVSDYGIIKSSSAILDEIIGNDDIIGGLSGRSISAKISSSSATVGNIKGADYIGGLVGYGFNIRVNSSLAIAETIQGYRNTGGLLGFGTNSTISYSSSIVRDIIGNQNIGGLLGWGGNAVIISSFSRVREMHGIWYAGGLFGYSDVITIDSSYAVADTINATRLVGYLTANTRGNDIVAVSSSYWDTNITFVNAQPTPYNASNPYYYGRGFSKEELQSPTIFDSGIYADWDSVYCNSATGEYRNSPAPNFIPIWDLGSASQYPALNCLPISPNEQRNITHQLILLDTDADGISNYFDTDDDGDNIADVIDNCPLNFNNYQNDFDDDGKGDICDDTDNDGVVDVYDLLPYDNTKTGDHDGDTIDSIEDEDDDGDGFTDITDSYPYDDTQAGDHDGDNIDSVEDVDSDGNGLIEISTADQLNMTRNNLAGTGLSNFPNQIGNTRGCGGNVAKFNNVKVCSGYELMTDIDLVDAGYNNWDPIGSCGGQYCSHRDSEYFNTEFNGNNHIISNLNINIATQSYGVGLFASMGENTLLKNIHIRGGNILAPNSNFVGGLVGYVQTDSEITSSTVELNKISGKDFVGGLVGIARSLQLNSVTTTLQEITASGSNIGGLVGRVWFGKIYSSSVTVGSITGSNKVGGLVGNGVSARVSSSSATIGSIMGNNDVAGIFGDSEAGMILSSSAIVGSITGSNRVGGLGGFGYGSETSHSFATIGSITGSDSVGGLLGSGETAVINYSYANIRSIDATSHSGGLVGLSGEGENPASVTNSYWNRNVMISPLPESTNTAGEAKSSSMLENSDFSRDIFTNWVNGWCNPSTGKFVEMANSPGNGYVRSWDFAAARGFPALNCLFFTPDEQRIMGRAYMDDSVRIPALPFNSSTYSIVEASAKTTWFIFTLDSPASISIEFSVLDGNFFTHASGVLYNKWGNEVALARTAEKDLNFEISRQLTAGTYYLNVFGGGLFPDIAPAGYSLSITEN